MQPQSLHFPARPSGGIGRRRGLKIPRPSGLAGSSPASGIRGKASTSVLGSRLCRSCRDRTRKRMRNRPGSDDHPAAIMSADDAAYTAAVASPSDNVVAITTRSPARQVCALVATSML
jgi:hypothetical protein